MIMDSEDTFDLVNFLKDAKKVDFPYNGKIDYNNRYQNIKEYLDIHIHPIIVSVAAKIDGGYLTDHGTDHINMVIDRVSKLIDQSHMKLTPYEAYLLLVSIQLHDTGHLINGRSKHEELSKEVIKNLGLLIGDETPEKTTIFRICDAHGGEDEKGQKKDKIGSLLPEDIILNKKIRPQLLSALLRFGDELAEDSTRANRYLLSENKILEGSEIFHAYASALHSVNVDIKGKQVNLLYNIKKDYSINQLQKKDSTKFLLDEIFLRIYKMYIESLYCMRYFPSENKINTLFVKIDFIDDDTFQSYFDTISIKLKENGYPKLHACNIYEICPEDLKYRDNGSITGELVKRIIENTQSS